MPPSSRRGRRNSRAGTIRLFLVLSALIAVNVYFLGFRGGTSIGALMHNTRVRGASPSEGATAAPTTKISPLPDDPIAGHIVDGQLADGQTIAQALTPRLGRRTASLLEETLSAQLDLGSVKVGQPYVLVYDVEDRLVAFEFRAGTAMTYRVELASQKPNLTVLTGKSETRTIELTVPAGPSMWEALRRAGEGPAVGERLCELYADEGDLCGPGAISGERVRLLVEKRLLGGKFQRYGRVVAAEWVTRAGTRRAFYWNSGEPGYYTERGDSLVRTARATPFRASRGLVRTRNTQRTAEGTVTIEYPAPTAGSLPTACAIAAGTVTGITRAPAGASVTLLVGEHEHHTYARLGRLARGLALGQKVEQGQALGRADAGLSLTVDGDAAARAGHNALPARVTALSSAERPRFGEAIAPMLERLRALALRPSDPLASRGLSAIP